MNLSALPDQRAAEDPLRPAVADDKTDLDNAQFLTAVQRAAASLRAHGVTAGDVVAIMLPNTASFVVALFAAWRVGAAVTPINPSLRPAEVTYQVSDAGAKLLIVEPYRVDEAKGGLAPTGRSFVVVDTLGAGLDEMVLICQGSSARLTPETEKLPIDAVVIGLVDTVDVRGRVVFSSREDAQGGR